MKRASPKYSTPGIMVRVSGALLPGCVVSTVLFGYEIVLLIFSAVGAAIITELLCTRTWRTIRDGSAIVTGLLIALCLPPTCPVWIPVIASAIGIAIGKQLFGGLGKNVFNPAMLGYAIVLIAYPVQLTYFDVVSGATALEVVAHNGGVEILQERTSHTSLGTLGASKFEWLNGIYLLAGIYLIVVRIIHWIIPVAVLVGLGLAAAFGTLSDTTLLGKTILFHWFAGGTMLTAFFIATDPVTSPSIRWQQWIYGGLVGVTAFVIRTFSSWPDGFAFAILLGNIVVPLLDRK
ncbi:MAG: RnfABCDGE type electron transport complex subunit D [Gammaproteobacteria bacterium]|nr:RnfABCDGE type electron transport complex subunit D [Gammaproteobacteria bacterium]